LTDPRRDALETVDYAIKKVLPEKAVTLSLQKETFPGRVVIVSIGKAAWRMAKAAVDLLGSQVSRGIVITKYGHSMGSIDGIEIFEAGHPFPDANSVLATSKAVKMVSGLGSDDTVLFLVSGGGSSLFEKPAVGVTLKDLQGVTGQLLSCGADIVEINTIRKRLSSVKGGRFARIASPARVFSIILSDVKGDRADSIASGPAFPDETTSEDALAIARKYSLRLKPELIASIGEETPKEIPLAKTVIAGSIITLCEAAGTFLAQHGYRTLLLTTSLSCEAREAGSFLAAVAREIRSSGNPIQPPCAMIIGGETVVHMKGKGKGGRNQELALAAAMGIADLPGTVIVSVGSDGTDGPTDAAGGIVDGNTMAELARLGIDAGKALDENDSGTALKACGGLVVTGPTGTNVNDLSMILCS